MARPRTVIGETKVCTRCGHAKPLTEFYLSRTKPSGYESHCKDCKRMKRADNNQRHSSAEAASVLERTCTKCLKTKPISEFNRDVHSASGWKWRCKVCVRRYQKAYNGERRETYRQRSSEHHLRLKLLVVKNYGGVCACCGESDWHFLCVDHIHNDGAEHRREIKQVRSRFYTWLKNNGFPKDRFQLLCFNCNQAKRYYGECPHVTTLKSLLSAEAPL